jgi:hypothetical protein
MRFDSSYEAPLSQIEGKLPHVAPDILSGVAFHKLKVSYRMLRRISFPASHEKNRADLASRRGRPLLRQLASAHITA